MATAIRKLVTSLVFFIVGASHVLQPRALADFLLILQRQGEAASLLNAFLHFPLGPSQGVLP